MISIDIITMVIDYCYNIYLITSPFTSLVINYDIMVGHFTNNTNHYNTHFTYIYIYNNYGFLV